MAKNKKYHLETLIEDPFFIRWAKGEVSEHTKSWEEHYRKDPDVRMVMEDARLVIQGIPFHQRYMSDQQVEEAWYRLDRTLQRLPDHHTHRGIPVNMFWRLAAALIILILAAGGGYIAFQNGKVRCQTDYGQRMVVTLPDNTVVTMNAHSTLWYTRINPRFVHMTGEIYFDVKKKPETNAPFIVQTPDLKIQVLGTEFNVNSRQERTEVLLDEGSVVLDLEKQGKVLMEPGDLVSYSAEENRILERHEAEKPEVITSWKEGVLMLDSVTLKDALTLLEETYNIKTVFENQIIGDKILIGGVPNNNLETCVKALTTIYHLDIKLEGDTLIVQ